MPDPGPGIENAVIARDAVAGDPRPNAASRGLPAVAELCVGPSLLDLARERGVSRHTMNIRRAKASGRFVGLWSVTADTAQPGATVPGEKR